MRTLILLAIFLVGCDMGRPAKHVQRGKQKQSHQNDMSQIALFYINYATERSAPPASFDELKTYMGADGSQLARLIESGEVVVRYGIKPNSQEIIVYERDTDLNGNHVVVRADRSVHTMPAVQLQPLLQGQ